MTMHLAPAPRAYRQSAIMTATPGQLVVMLYDGAQRFLHQAAAATADRNVELAHNKLRRAEDIIAHLLDTLDMEQGDIAQRLQAIYMFCQRYLNEARVERDPTKIERVAELLGTLRGAWAEIAARPPAAVSGSQAATA
jgi:flagellar protein FliS